MQSPGKFAESQPKLREKYVKSRKTLICHKKKDEKKSDMLH